MFVLKIPRIILQSLLIAVGFVAVTSAQTTAFNYQGRLTDTGAAQSTYLMRFKLFDAVTGGNQIGSTIPSTIPDVIVSVNQGVFNVLLDFSANAFTGADRFLEIGVRRNANENYTILSPRQQITSSPFSIRTLSAAQADVALDSVKLGGVAASDYVTTTSGGNSFIKNSTAQQTDAKFNIDGNGTLGGTLLANRVGINVASLQAGINLDLSGNSVFRTANGNINLGTPNSETGITVTNANRADFRFNGSTLKLVAGSGTAPPPDTNGIVINTLGNVGIGTTNLGRAKLQVDGFTEDGIFGSSAAGNGVSGQGDNGVRGFSNTSGGRGVYGISLNGNGVEGSSNGSNKFGVFSNGFLGTDRIGTAGNPPGLCLNNLNQIAFCSSSLRYKTDLQPFGGGLSIINRLRPITFKWKTNNMLDVGFGAEDVADIEPLFTFRNDRGEIEGVKYDRLSVVFVNAFKEQQTQIERQNERIARQETLLDAQQRQLDQLKKLVCELQPQAEICH